ncbi:Ankyrin repeat region domain-containing protein [Forsythia ovata]|uniref:Ankyrin repeat region domain-containing protein n=1 Tax=Forsythia ovata TaxID=205694 RepID=A0ABD1W5Y4_9LAMI
MNKFLISLRTYHQRSIRQMTAYVNTLPEGSLARKRTKAIFILSIITALPDDSFIYDNFRMIPAVRDSDIGKYVFEAAAAGNMNYLRKLLQEDPLILDRVVVNCLHETTMHIALLFGHTDFVR